MHGDPAAETLCGMMTEIFLAGRPHFYVKAEMMAAPNLSQIPRHQ
jgi:hypothetical protein